MAWWPSERIERAWDATEAHTRRHRRKYQLVGIAIFVLPTDDIIGWLWFTAAPKGFGRLAMALTSMPNPSGFDIARWVIAAVLIGLFLRSEWLHRRGVVVTTQPWEKTEAQRLFDAQVRERTIDILSESPSELDKCRRQIAGMKLKHFAELRAHEGQQLSVTVRGVLYERSDVIARVEKLFPIYTPWSVNTERLATPSIAPKTDADITVLGNDENRFMGEAASALRDLLGYQVATRSLGHDSDKRSVIIDVHPLPKP